MTVLVNTAKEDEELYMPIELVMRRLIKHEKMEREDAAIVTNFLMTELDFVERGNEKI